MAGFHQSHGPKFQGRNGLKSNLVNFQRASLEICHDPSKRRLVSHVSGGPMYILKLKTFHWSYLLCISSPKAIMAPDDRHFPANQENDNRIAQKGKTETSFLKAILLRGKMEMKWVLIALAVLH